MMKSGKIQNSKYLYMFPKNKFFQNYLNIFSKMLYIFLSILDKKKNIQ